MHSIQWLELACEMTGTYTSDSTVACAPCPVGSMTDTLGFASEYIYIYRESLGAPPPLSDWLTPAWFATAVQRR